MGPWEEKRKWRCLAKIDNKKCSVHFLRAYKFFLFARGRVKGIFRVVRFLLGRVRNNVLLQAKKMALFNRKSQLLDPSNRHKQFLNISGRKYQF